MVEVEEKGCQRKLVEALESWKEEERERSAPRKRGGGYCSLWEWMR